MKQLSMAAILMALVLGGFTSCTKDNSGTSAASTTSITNGDGKSTPPIGNTRTILESGSWKITASSNGSYEGYVFNFSDDGTTRVINGSSTYTGSWATTAERQDLLHLEYGTPAELAALSGDWQVVSISTTTIELRSTDGKGSFTFVKI